MQTNKHYEIAEISWDRSMVRRQGVTLWNSQSWLRSQRHVRRRTTSSLSKGVKIFYLFSCKTTKSRIVKLPKSVKAATSHKTTKYCSVKKIRSSAKTAFIHFIHIIHSFISFEVLTLREVCKRNTLLCFEVQHIVLRTKNVIYMPKRHCSKIMSFTCWLHDVFGFVSNKCSQKSD